MIAAKLAQRRLVQLKQNLAQLLGFRVTGCEALSVNLTQHADEGVSVLVADFVVLVAVAIVETGLDHAALHGAQGAASSRSGEMATKDAADGGLVWQGSSPSRQTRGGYRDGAALDVSHQAAGGCTIRLPVNFGDFEANRAVIHHQEQPRR